MAAWDGADLGKCRPRLAQARRIWASPKTWRKVQGSLTLIWIALGVPSVLWWSHSIPWLVGISVWANVAGHFSGWQGSRAEDNGSD